MYKIANISKKDREALFRNTADKYGLNEAIIEKDFWACWTLRYLFNESPWNDSFAFKGGTSLSKGYGLIERFSEDIDLVLDWRLLGYSKDEPWIERSKTQQRRFNDDINQKAVEFIEKIMLPEIGDNFTKQLSEKQNVFISEDNPHTICFIYPQSHDDDSILNQIRLEIGPLATWTPSRKIAITPYAAEKYPGLFTEPSTSVLTVKPERTFWEKITILHREAYRTNGNFPSRYSRHYYDVEKLASTEIKKIAFSNIDVLDQVVKFKSKFYPMNAARYDLAKPGTMKLIPSEENMKLLEKDYKRMQNMIYGNKLSFDVLMRKIEDLENEINQLGLLVCEKNAILYRN